MQLRQKYLKGNKLLVRPFDKGIGICIIKRGNLQRSIDQYLTVNLPQFEKLVSKRKNEKHLVLEERMTSVLKKLRDMAR